MSSQYVDIAIAHPFSECYLYQQDRANVQNMLLKAVNYPDRVLRSKSHYVWSDTIPSETWNAAVKGLKSRMNGDAFFAGLSDKDFMTFAVRLGTSDVVGCRFKITGARIVHFTNRASEYPCLRVEFSGGGKMRPPQWHRQQEERMWREEMLRHPDGRRMIEMMERKGHFYADMFTD
jgi:hypothetical protein